MQIDIAQHIEKLLFEHETVIVPSFGGFTATRSPASLDAVGGTIAPPSKTLAFNENLTVDDGILAHDLSYSHGMAEDDARRLISEFVENTRQALDQREIVTLPGIGRLYKNYAQKVQFLPDTTNFNTDSFGLPKIQFSSVPRTQTETAPAPSANGNSVAAKAPLPTNGEIGNGQAAKEEVQAVAKELVAESPMGHPPIETAAVSEAEVTREVKKRMFSPTAIGLGGILLAAIGLAVFFFINRSTETQPLAEISAPPPVVPGVGDLASVPSKAEAPVEEEKDDDVGGDIPDEVDEYEAKRQEAEAQLQKEAAKPSKPAASTPKSGQRRCVLIVGTFQNKANVNKLLDKLRGAGFDTYHRRDKGHQVGIEFHYSDLKEVQQKMKDLQDLTGEDNIWIKKK